MSATTYTERLADPRWQRKRTEILQRDNFTCQECGATDQELHVHHGYYAKGMAPWQYPSDSLHTLCHECHKLTEAVLEEIRPLMGRLALSGLADILTWLKTMEEPGAAPTAAHAHVTEDQELVALNTLLLDERRRQGILPDGSQTEVEAHNAR